MFKKFILCFYRFFCKLEMVLVWVTIICMLFFPLISNTSVLDHSRKSFATLSEYCGYRTKEYIDNWSIDTSPANGGILHFRKGEGGGMAFLRTTEQSSLHPWFSK